MDRYACYDFVRNITNLIGKQSSIFTKNASLNKGKIIGHHLIQAEDFFNEWRNCVENDLEFTIEDAKKCFINAKNLFVTYEEHIIIHSSEFKQYKIIYNSKSIFEILKHFNIEINE